VTRPLDKNQPKRGLEQITCSEILSIYYLLFLIKLETELCLHIIHISETQGFQTKHTIIKPY